VFLGTRVFGAILVVRGRNSKVFFRLLLEVRDQTPKRSSQIAKERGLGGYNERSGRGHKGRYKGYWCDSSYELAWVVYNLDHGIAFTRNTTKFQYQFDGKTCNWIPDFILEDGTYVEIKGFETDQSRAKIRDFPHPIKLLKEVDLAYVFQYVRGKYGADFVRLYTEG
jgi:hypothetical protein